VRSWNEVGYEGLFRHLAAYTNGEHVDDLDPDRDFEFGDVEWDEIWSSEFIDLGDFKFRRIDSYGGEGQGDEYWMVLEVEFSDVIKAFELSGYYASYDGGYYEDIKEVKPMDKVITVWVAV
jgi:hypothetical protein